MTDSRESHSGPWRRTSQGLLLVLVVIGACVLSLWTSAERARRTANGTKGPAVLSREEQTHLLLDRRWREIGYDALLPEEQDFVALWWLEVDVDNGGFHQYFSNSTGDDALHALNALENVGATKTQGILQEALALLDGVGGYSPDREERWTVLEALPEGLGAFRALDERFYAREENFQKTALVRVAEVYAAKDLTDSESADR